MKREGYVMERLIKPVEYAHQLGISRQAVYAKIKRGILESKSVDGKLYIVVDEKSQQGKAMQEEASSSEQKSWEAEPVNPKKREKSLDYETLLQAKDETIDVLKGTVKDLKESNRQMSTTLRGEIDLLKEAFHEMRTLYVTQIEQIRKPEAAISSRPIEVATLEEKGHKKKEHGWISLKKFFKKHAIEKRKKQENVIKKLKKAYKKGDARILNKKGEIKVRKNERLEDIVG